MSGATAVLKGPVTAICLTNIAPGYSSDARVVRQLSDTQIAWLEGQPGHWLGRAQTRREAADWLRREDHVKEADYCLQVASEYEQKAAEVAKGTN